MSHPMNVVEVENLSRQYGKLQALDSVSIQMRPGSVYGLVGSNGAGKTTLMKHLIGLLKAREGTVRIFGLDPVAHPVEVLGRIGYLSEERDLPEWMRIEELLNYSAAFYPGWDRAYARELLDTFGLDPTKKVSQLSKGMRAQAGLVAAVAHHPELLLLDEPSTGLDAVVRKDILNAIIRTVADNGRTAIFSSHLLDEVELMSDYVFMINHGKLVLSGSLEAIREKHQQVNVRSPSEQHDLPAIEGLLSKERSGDAWTVVCAGADHDVHQAIQSAGCRISSSRNATLQEIFVARVGRVRTPEGGA